MLLTRVKAKKSLETTGLLFVSHTFLMVGQCHLSLTVIYDTLFQQLQVLFQSPITCFAVNVFVVKVEVMAQMRPSELSVKRCVMHDSQPLGQHLSKEIK